MFKDSEFEISSKVFTELYWLPEIPSASEETLQGITVSIQKNIITLYFIVQDIDFYYVC